MGRGSWVRSVGPLVRGRGSWSWWWVVRGSWVMGVSVVWFRCPFRLSFGCSLRFTRRRGAKLLPSLCTREWAARGSELHSCTASRLARTAAARQRLVGVAPRLLLLPSLCTRRWAARGSDLRWVLAQHRGSCCGASAVGRRGAQTLALGTRGSDSCPRHARVAARGPDVRSWSARPPAYALAQHRGGSYCCGASAVGRRGAQALALALHAKVGSARLRLRLSHSVAALLLRRVRDWAA